MAGEVGRAVRERWLGATGRRIAEIVVEGDVDFRTTRSCWRRSTKRLCATRSTAACRSIVRADTADEVRAALARPEVSCVVVPAERRELLELDLRSLTYG